MIEYNQETKRLNKIILQNANISEIEFLENEINEFLNSEIRKSRLTAQNYLIGKQDILKRKRTIIGENGEIEEVNNLPNNKIIDNQYAKMVEQKNSYLLSKKVVFECSNKEYLKQVENILDARFNKTLLNLSEDAINCGIGFVYIYVDENSNLKFKKLNPSNVLPFWADEEHTILDMLVYIYPQQVYKNKIKETITKVEVYNKTSIKCYTLEKNKLCFEEEKPYILLNNKNYSWKEIPIIAFKSNSKEIPLLNKVKSLQDALNIIRSDFLNNMQEDVRNTILVLKNYDGEDLGEFRKKLSMYGAVKVTSADGYEGGVETLKIDINSNNYEIIINMLKKAIIENARGYDCKDERMANNPNRLNIQSMYSDIDLDANYIEVEYKFAFEQIFNFINYYLEILNRGSFFNDKIEVIFNKDQLINETEVIENCSKSMGIISNETIIKNHPWVDDFSKELKILEKDEETELKKIEEVGVYEE